MTFLGSIVNSVDFHGHNFFCNILTLFAARKWLWCGRYWSIPQDKPTSQSLHQNEAGDMFKILVTTT